MLDVRVKPDGRYGFCSPGSIRRVEVSTEIPENVLTELMLSSAATLIADDHGRYVAANRAACRLLGYSQDELLKMDVWDLTPGDHQLDGLILWQQFISRGADAGVYWLKRKDGSIVEVAYKARANVAPGLHISSLVPHDSMNQPFERSRFRR
jgi:PAS domain S-box-containing protein